MELIVQFLEKCVTYRVQRPFALAFIMNLFQAVESVTLIKGLTKFCLGVQDMCCDVPKLDKIMLDEVLPTMLEREIISEAERWTIKVFIDSIIFFA